MENCPEKDDIKHEIDIYKDFLSFEYQDFRLKKLVEKIKIEHYRPRTKFI